MAKKLFPSSDGHTARLPDDVLADVLGRLAPRWLAASRCVCKAWRAAIDARRLLRADLLPLSLQGLLIHFKDHNFVELFSRPGSPPVSGVLDFLPNTNISGVIFDPDHPEHFQNYWNTDRSDDVDWHGYRARDHCNGLLLLDSYVVNPATRRWDPLPPGPRLHPFHAQRHLVFDPMLSPHYEVFVIPRAPSNSPDDAWNLDVYSSRLGRWEERSFAQEGDAAGTVAGMEASWTKCRAYWRGALYVLCENYYVIRISLSTQKYRVIQPPTGVREGRYPSPYLERSEKGVYFASIEKCWLQVWVLDDESLRWVLKHDRDLVPVLARRHFLHSGRRQVSGPWTLEDINYKLYSSRALPREENKDINSQDDFQDRIVSYPQGSDSYHAVYCGGMVMEFQRYRNGDLVEEGYLDGIEILGFHPYKEIIFMSESVQTGLAYHFDTFKVEALGNIYPRNYMNFKEVPNERDGFWYSFPYTPCRIEEVLGSN